MMTPEQALNLLAACARKVLVIEQGAQYDEAIKVLLPLIQKPPAQEVAKAVE